MIHSQVDRPDLFSLLLRKRVWFLMGLLSVEFRLALHACGLGTVDVRNLLGSLDSMRADARAGCDRTAFGGVAGRRVATGSIRRPEIIVDACACMLAGRIYVPHFVNSLG